MSAGLVAVTVTPGSTELLGSLTRPKIVPVVPALPPCAAARAGSHMVRAIAAAIPFIIRIIIRCPSRKSPTSRVPVFRLRCEA